MPDIGACKGLADSCCLAGLICLPETAQRLELRTGGSCPRKGPFPMVKASAVLPSWRRQPKAHQIDRPECPKSQAHQQDNQHEYRPSSMMTHPPPEPRSLFLHRLAPTENDRLLLVYTLPALSGKRCLSSTAETNDVGELFMEHRYDADKPPCWHRCQTASGQNACRHRRT